MPNIALTLAYDGSDFAGWQIQPNVRTVQRTLEQTIEKLTGQPASVLSAGRTDSGVHALGQVASFHTTANIPTQSWPKALNALLPDDVAVLSARLVPNDFHATYWTRSKRYRYLIHNVSAEIPFLRKYAWRFGPRLDTPGMHQAAQLLLGMHDFRSFESHYPNTTSSIRTINDISVHRQSGWHLWSSHPLARSPIPLPEDDFVVIEVAADGFLYNMVRAITGTLLRVGLGKLNELELQRILDAQDRSTAFDTAPAQGLYLVSVEYGDSPNPKPAPPDE